MDIMHPDVVIGFVVLMGPRGGAPRLPFGPLRVWSCGEGLKVHVAW